MNRGTETTHEVPHPVQDEERCPKCTRDFATCRCYDNQPEDETPWKNTNGWGRY